MTLVNPLVRLRLRLLLRGARPVMARIFFVAMVSGGVVLLGVGLWTTFSKKSSVALKDQGHTAAPSPAATRIKEAIMEADFEAARRLLSGALALTPADPMLGSIQAQLTEDLEVVVNLHSLPGENAHAAGGTEVGGLVLRSKAPCFLTVNPSDRCYLYVFQLDATGEGEPLFPNRRFLPETNPVGPGPFRLPGNAEWFTLDDTPGEEEIFVVASRWPQERLGQLAAQIEASTGPEKKMALVQKLREQLERLDAATEKVPGLAVGRCRFLHVAS